MMTDVNFQTKDVNAKYHERIRAAREVVDSATGMLILTLLKAYPVGARVRLQVGPKKVTPYTVTKHTVIPSKWVTLRHDKTGSRRTVDIITAGIELVEYSYEVTKLATSDPEGHQQAITDENERRSMVRTTEVVLRPEDYVTHPVRHISVEDVRPEDYHFTSGSADPLKSAPAERRLAVVTE